MRRSQRAVCLDASAIVAHHHVSVETDEPDSEVLRQWLRQEATKYTTPLCFFESLNVYKSKWFHKKKWTFEQYREACFATYTWYQASNRYIKDVDFNKPAIFHEAYLLALKHNLDLSDALQLVSVRDGFFSVLVNESSTILCTGDSGLAVAARSEGLRVWNFRQEAPPA
jgi:predicted nucleic acid-binding protein